MINLMTMMKFVLFTSLKAQIRRKKLTVLTNNSKIFKRFNPWSIVN